MFVGGSKDISEYHFGRKIGESMQLKAEKTHVLQMNGKLKASQTA